MEQFALRDRSLTGTPLEPHLPSYTSNGIMACLIDYGMVITMRIGKSVGKVSLGDTPATTEPLRECPLKGNGGRRLKVA